MGLQENKKTIEQYLDDIKEELSLCKGEVSQQLQDHVAEFGRWLQEASPSDKEMACIGIRNLLKAGHKSIKVYLYSFLVNILQEREDLVEFFHYIRSQECLRKEEKFFLYYQIKQLMFMYKALDNTETRYQKWMLFRKIYESFHKEVNVPLDAIPMEERNPNLILFITEQMLGLCHAPTRNTLERCAACIKTLGKEVLLLNTAEAASFVGYTPFYGARVCYYNEELSDVAKLEYGGVQIAYMQCEQNMPRVDILELLLLEIRRLCPCCIITMGGNSILANLANLMVPVLSIGLGFSELEATEVDYQTLGRPLMQGDIELLGLCEKPLTHVIPTKFTFDLKPQTIKLERKDLKIPEDKFVSVVVGTRLKWEVTDAFAEMLESAISEEDYVLFAGEFSDYDAFMHRHPKLRSHSEFIGFQEEMLAVLECCDLFVNPDRKGGGTSAVEAMVKGVPVVTTSYGDVACDVGEEFVCQDYQEMSLEIIRYRNDKEYYKKKSRLAMDRAKILLDSGTAFFELIKEYEKREQDTQDTEASENKMLEQACEKFQEGRYEEALKDFIAVYAKGYEKDWILENIYRCYLEGNEQEFQNAYEKYKGLDLIPYEDCTLDFIPYRDGEYFIFDKEQELFYGLFSVNKLQETECSQAMRELEFGSVALELDWNWNLQKHILTGAKARKIYAVCHDIYKGMSFYKIPELEEYMRNVRMFADKQQLQRYFHENTSVYLPKLFFGSDINRGIWEIILKQEHEYRLTPEGRNTENVLLTIGIPTFARGNLLLDRIENLCKMDYDAEIEIAVSKNGKKLFEEEYERVRQNKDARINYVDQGEELVYIDNWRRTIAMSHGKYVLMVSDEDDVIIDAIGHYLKLLEQHPELTLVRARTAKQYSFIKKDRYSKKGREAFEVGFLTQNYLSGLIIQRNAFIEAKMEKLDSYMENNFYKFYPHEWWCLDLYFMGDYKEDSVGLVLEGDVIVENGLVQEEKMSPEEKLQALPFYARYENRLEQAKDYLGCIHLLEKRGNEIVETALKKAFGKAAWLMSIAYEYGYKVEEYSEALGSLTELYISALDEFELGKQATLRVLDYFMEICKSMLKELGQTTE